MDKILKYSFLLNFIYCVECGSYSQIYSFKVQKFLMKVMKLSVLDLVLHKMGMRLIFMFHVVLYHMVPLNQNL